MNAINDLENTKKTARTKKGSSFLVSLKNSFQD